MSKFSKVRKLTINRNLLILCTKTNYPRELEKATPSTTASHTTNCSGVSLTEDVRDLCAENCAGLVDDVEEDTRKWKDIQCLWIGRIKIVRMPILP